LIKGHRTEARIVDIGGQRRGPARWANAAGHEPRLVWIAFGKFVGDAPRDLGGGPIDGCHRAFELILGHRDRGRVKRIGLDDVGPGLEILPMDVLDDVRASQAQEIVAAPQLFRVIGELRAAKVGLFQLMLLDHRPHRAVEHEDPREQQFLEAGDCGGGG
jgi:hypothetical protein